MSLIVITKIKLDGKPKAVHPVKISYTRDSVIGFEEITINGHDQPNPELLNLMDGWLSLVISSCRLDSDEWDSIARVGDAQVIGLSIKRDEGGEARGINLTAVGKFPNDDDTVSCVVINSPYLAVESLEPSDLFALERIEKEAIAYLNGKKAQLSLIETPVEVPA